jgi:hypothetical protein
VERLSSSGPADRSELPGFGVCQQILSSASGVRFFHHVFFLAYENENEKAELSQSPLSYRRQCHCIQTTDVNANGTVKTHPQLNPVPHQIETVMTIRQRTVTVAAETDTTATRINMEAGAVRRIEIVVMTEEVQVLLESLGNIHRHRKLPLLLLILLPLQVLPKS